MGEPQLNPDGYSVKGCSIACCDDQAIDKLNAELRLRELEAAGQQRLPTEVLKA